MGSEVVVDTVGGVVVKFRDGVGVPYKSLNASCELQKFSKQQTPLVPAASARYTPLLAWQVSLVKDPWPQYWTSVVFW